MAKGQLENTGAGVAYNKNGPYRNKLCTMLALQGSNAALLHVS
jgi:hypothetical protein